MFGNPIWGALEEYMSHFCLLKASQSWPTPSSYGYQLIVDYAVHSKCIKFRWFLTIMQGVISPEMKRCYQLLSQTSRSFAAVIQALDDELRYTLYVHLGQLMHVHVLEKLQCSKTNLHGDFCEYTLTVGSFQCNGVWGLLFSANNI